MRFSLVSVFLLLILSEFGSCSTSSNDKPCPELVLQSDIVTEVRLMRQLLNQETMIRMELENKIAKLTESLGIEIVKHENNTLEPDTEKRQGYGQIYTRWGKNICRNGSELIYSGMVGGSDSYKQSGAAVDHLCLPPDPIYDRYDPKVNDQAYVFGAEYDIWNIDVKGTLFDKAKYTQKGVPCAVCRPTTPSSVIMIPGRNACYKGMTEEYRGYLMAGYHSHVGASEYICVDRDAGAITPKVHSWRKILYAVESMCGGPMECPPYINGAEMTCVVCTM